MVADDNGTGLELEMPTKEQLSEWYAEVGITPDGMRRDINHLKNWMSRQPHLPHITDDVVYERFLFGCKNSLEGAKLKLEQYYTARATMPEYFANRDPLDEELREALKTVCYVVLPRLTSKGYRIIICKMFNHDITKFKPNLLFKGALMLSDMTRHKCQSNGVVIIFDLYGRTMAHVASVTFPMLRNVVHCIMSAFPEHMKGFHIVNASGYTNTLITLGKSLLKDKLRNRIHTHSKGVATLAEHISKDVLPAEYGGTYEHNMVKLRDFTYELLVRQRDWYLKEQSVKADLTKKVEGKKEERNIFGIEGSFRAIRID
ncbi:alpha-tocopherol transfer protein-like [Lycorma delicatula]|uniref:alpha-tocopherol transfer protein-like n=1 Tax=Lycorma delicatula TaxID=130591 RepID=UPI003F5188DE